MGPVGDVQGGSTAGLDGDPGAVVHRCGGVHRYAGVPVLIIVIPEEVAAEYVGVFDRPELAGKCGTVLEGLVVNTNAGGGRWQFTGRGAV